MVSLALIKKGKRKNEKIGRKHLDVTYISPFLQPSSAQGIQHNSLFIFLINNWKLLLEIHKAMRHQEAGHSLHNCFDLIETIVESPHYCMFSPIPLNLFSTIQPPRQVERMKQIISTLSKIVLVPVSCSIVLENCIGAYISSLLSNIYSRLGWPWIILLVLL